MRKARRANLERLVERGAARLRRRRLAEEAARGAENARAAGREKGLGRSPGEGDPIAAAAAPALPAVTARKRKVAPPSLPPAGGFVHVDIPADDPARAARFFAEVFGWGTQELPGATPYWLLLPGTPGVGAGIGKRELASQTVTPTIGVASVSECAARIAAAGGAIVTPATALPGVGLLMVFSDTEGNLFSALEPAPGEPFAPPPAKPPRRRNRG